jgi:transcription initiation factor TFIIE subunit beta
LDLAQMKSLGQGGSQFKFGVLAKIVRHMKSRHMEGEDQPLTLEDILDETNQVNTTTSVAFSFLSPILML